MYFAFNDPELDSKQLKSLNIGDIGIVMISDENINYTMDRSEIKPKNVLSRWIFAFRQSENRMDFNANYTLPSRGITLGNGEVAKDKDGQGGFMVFTSAPYRAYNLNDAGQFSMGQCYEKTRLRLC